FGRRAGATVGGYLLGLTIVGHDFNQYWGAMLAPLMCFGFARSLAAVTGLWRACRWRLELPRGPASRAPGELAGATS
ncbi:MAG: hypothetical protein HY000_39640, partial [Planctomycetes bacterium]|nr:hypothetical protein [Planctomycetota bacterium]